MLKDRRGVSPVFGALLIFMIFIVVFSTIQSYQVPIWNKQMEYDHFEVVNRDMAKLRSTIEDVATYKTPKTCVMHLGVKYPDRAIFINPGPGASGMLSFEPINVSIECRQGASSRHFNFSSLRIRYDAYGIASLPSIINEHGLLLYSYKGRDYTFEEQPLVSGDEIYVPILTGSAKSISKIGTESLRIAPFSSTMVIRNVSSVNITLQTNFPDVWKDVFGTEKTFEGCSNASLRLYSDAIREVEIPTNPKGTLCGGIIRFSTKVSPLPRVTNIDTSKPNYPIITNISVIRVNKTHCTITAVVKNATAPFDIHADFTDLTKDPLKYDVMPDYSSPGRIDAVSWDLPNKNNVSWTKIKHPHYTGKDVVIVTFWVFNSENNMVYTTSRVVTMH